MSSIAIGRPSRRCRTPMSSARRANTSTRRTSRSSWSATPTRSCRGSRAPRSARSSSTARSSPARQGREAPTQPEPPGGAARPVGRLASAFPALASRTFRVFLLSSMIATVGAFMQQTAQGWLVLELTNSAALLGLAGAAAGLPTLFLVIVAGVLADRLDRRRVLITTNAVVGLCALALALLTTLGVVQYWHVLVLALL